MISVSLPALRHIITQHQGNRTAIARANKWSGNTVRRLIAMHGLISEADDAAIAAGRSGPREASEEAMQLERERLMHALPEGPAAAAVTLGWSIASVYRKRRMYEITEEEIAALITDQQTHL